MHVCAPVRRCVAAFGTEKTSYLNLTLTPTLSPTRRQMRGFRDGSAGYTYSCTEDENTICSGWGSAHTNCNLGGHDFMNNLVKFLTNTVESGHCGYPLVDQAQAAADLHEMGVPMGSHTFAMQYHHGDNAEASYVIATLDAGNT